MSGLNWGKIFSARTCETNVLQHGDCSEKMLAPENPKCYYWSLKLPPPWVVPVCNSPVPTMDTQPYKRQRQCGVDQQLSDMAEPPLAVTTSSGPPGYRWNHWILNPKCRPSKGRAGNRPGPLPTQDTYTLCSQRHTQSRSGSLQRLQLILSTLTEFILPQPDPCQTREHPCQVAETGHRLVR